ncbi:MAG: VacJ family lipoprotein, partial [Nitrospiria bacterium]
MKRVMQIRISGNHSMQRYKLAILSVAAFLVLAGPLSLAAASAAGDAVGSAEAGTGTDGEPDDTSDKNFEEFEDEFGDVTGLEIFDPLAPSNRLLTRFNDTLHEWVIKPSAIVYNTIVPEPGRTAISRFFKNLLFPIRFVNNILQLKFKEAWIELARFTVNTTIGVLGFFDPAESWLNLEPQPEDFGQTLGFYGIGGGVHIVLPLLGPSNLRDIIGKVADQSLTYSSYIYEGS